MRAAGLWALCVAVAPFVAAQCDSGEFFDSGPYQNIYTNEVDTYQDLCNSSARPSTDFWVQLSTPPVVPWRYTSICFSLAPDNATQTRSAVYGKVHVISLAVDTEEGKLIPGESMASTGFALSLPKYGDADWDGGTINWVTIDLSKSRVPLVAWSRGVLVGVSFWSCEKLWFATCESLNMTGRLCYEKYSGEWDQCGQGDFLSATRSTAIRTTGEAYSGVPSDWTCEDAAYNNGTKCDCLCGAWDPDCKDDPHSTDCPSGSICDQSARCVAVEWDFTKCNATNYWAHDGCQCMCGKTTDPDCFDPFMPVSVCAGGKFIEPFCSLSENGSVCAEQWTCNASAYNDGEVCDCECGILDPDCSNEDLPTTCEDNFLCHNGACKVPHGWKCADSDYNSGQCMCTCGAYDISCDEDVYVWNCAHNLVCNYEGNCVAQKCGNNHTETWKGEECDGGTGCSSECACLPGWSKKTPARMGCVEVCGDGNVVGTEECDGGKWCTECSCDAGHSPYTPAQTSCIGCGNNNLDENETCDGGRGCNANCTCMSGYYATTPVSTDCMQDSDGGEMKVKIAGSVGGSAGVLLLVAMIAAVAYARKVKYGPRPLNLPVEMTGDAVSTGGFVSSPEQTLPLQSTDLGVIAIPSLVGSNVFSSEQLCTPNADAVLGVWNRPTLDLHLSAHNAGPNHSGTSAVPAGQYSGSVSDTGAVHSFDLAVPSLATAVPPSGEETHQSE